MMFGQTTYSYTFDNNTVHVSPTPTVFGVYPPTNFSTIKKPLIAEPFATNARCVSNANLIHPSAGNVSNVFFGGDMPSGGDGTAATPVFTQQIFALKDFPIYVESDFYTNSSPDYNEFYFWMGPSNYQTFSATFATSGLNSREGVRIGRFPNNFEVTNENSSTQPFTRFLDTLHNLANYGQWFNCKAIFDTLGGNLILRDVKINNTPLLNRIITISNTPWLNSYRLAVCSDDLIKGFTIITNYSSEVNGYGKEVPEKNIAKIVYPNPAENILNLEFNENIKEVTIEIIDALGRVKNLSNHVNTNKVQVNVENLETGTYFVKISSNKIKQSISFIKK